MVYGWFLSFNLYAHLTSVEDNTLTLILVASLGVSSCVTTICTETKNVLATLTQYLTLKRQHCAILTPQHRRADKSFSFESL